MYGWDVGFETLGLPHSGWYQVGHFVSRELMLFPKISSHTAHSGNLC